MNPFDTEIENILPQPLGFTIVISSDLFSSASIPRILMEKWNISVVGDNVSQSHQIHEITDMWVSLNSLYESLQKLREKGLIEEETVNEILGQKVIFEERKDELIEYLGKVVVVCNGDFFIGDTLDEARNRAKERCGNKPYYSETIGLIDIPSMFSPI
ncbi:MAG: hypothetical protein H3Z54_05665 [archaeon]|nr:hypothetical protein [archaeon]